MATAVRVRSCCRARKPDQSMRNAAWSMTGVRRSCNKLSRHTSAYDGFRVGLPGDHDQDIDCDGFSRISWIAKQEVIGSVATVSCDGRESCEFVGRNRRRQRCSQCGPRILPSFELLPFAVWPNNVKAASRSVVGDPGVRSHRLPAPIDVDAWACHDSDPRRVRCIQVPRIRQQRQRLRSGA